jgi:hypothetical protein
MIISNIMKTILAIIQRIVLRAMRPNRAKGISISKVECFIEYNQITGIKVFEKQLFSEI